MALRDLVDKADAADRAALDRLTALLEEFVALSVELGIKPSKVHVKAHPDPLDDRRDRADRWDSAQGDVTPPNKRPHFGPMEVRGLALHLFVDAETCAPGVGARGLARVPEPDDEDGALRFRRKLAERADDIEAAMVKYLRKHRATNGS